MTCKLPEIVRALTERQQARYIESLTIRCCPDCTVDPKPR